MGHSDFLNSGGQAAASPARPSAEAFTKAFEVVAPRIWSWASIHIGPSLRSMIEPSDLVQEVACRAWERMTTFDPNRGAFDGWIFGIARNVMGEALKRVARGGQNDWSTDRWTKVPDDATRVTARVARDETLGELVAWVADLPKDERRLVVYRGLEGRGHAEVGELVGLDASAAAKRWERLRDRLRSGSTSGERLVALLAD